MTEKERQLGYYYFCMIPYDKIPNEYDHPAWYAHEGWMQGSGWASKHQQEIDIDKACNLLIQELTQIQEFLDFDINIAGRVQAFKEAIKV